MLLNIFYKWKDGQQVRLIDEILNEENISLAIKRVVANKGASGIDKVIGKNTGKKLLNKYLIRSIDHNQ